MTLHEYLKKYKVSMTVFAFRCGISVASITHYMSGTRKPRQKVAEAIERETAERVTVMELRGKDDRAARL